MSKYQEQAAKFDYEFMGRSAEEVQRIHDLPAVYVNSQISSGQWERRIEPTALPDTKDIDAFAKQLEGLTRARLTIISLFRQIDNQPLYAQIERALLEKVFEIINNIHPLDDKGPNKLQALSRALESLQQRNPVELSDDLAKKLKDGPKVQVLIQNQLGKSEELIQ